MGIAKSVSKVYGRATAMGVKNVFLNEITREFFLNQLESEYYSNLNFFRYFFSFYFMSFTTPTSDKNFRTPTQFFSCQNFFLFLFLTAPFSQPWLHPTTELDNFISLKFGDFGFLQN